MPKRVPGQNDAPKPKPQPRIAPHGGVDPKSGLRFVPRSLGVFPAERDAVRDPGDDAENGAQGQAVSDSKHGSVGDGAGERAERAVLAAEQIVGEVESAQQIERTADDADHESERGGRSSHFT